ncbi:MAG: hypothetical protein ACRDQA_24445 [Nocardioidaceae bacterium]
MPWQSSLPVAVNALVAQLSADSTLAAIVHDGPELRDTGNEVVAVGYSGDDGDTAAEGSFSREGLALEPDRERYSIHCAVSVLNGAADTGKARARAYELFAVVGKVLAADKTLGDAVMSASLGGWSLSTPQTESGAVATITFNVEIDAYTST